MQRFFILVAAGLAFFAAARDFAGPEAEVYYAYTASIVDDGDLDIADQLPGLRGGLPIITADYQYPDFHNHGGVLFWAPFYLLNKIYPGVLPMSTLLFALVALFLCRELARRLAPGRDATVATALVFFGTPLVYYALWEPGNANVAAMLAMTLVIGAYFAEEDSLVVGVLAGVAAVVKIDCWFLLPATAMRGPRRFLAGFLPIIALKAVNDTIRQGSLALGELAVVNPHGSYFWEQAFSTYHGFFFCSPLLAVAIWGIAREPRLRPFGLCLLVKIVAIASRYAWGGGCFGARILLTETPLFIAGLACVLARARGGLKTTLVGLVGWNLFLATVFAAGEEGSLFAGRVPLGELVVSARAFLGSLSLPPAYPYAYVAPMTLLLLPLRRVSFRGAAIFAGGGYVALTLANAINTGPNIRRAREAGVFARATVVEKNHAGREENRNSVREMIRYYAARANEKKVAELTALEARLARD